MDSMNIKDNALPPVSKRPEIIYRRNNGNGHNLLPVSLTPVNTEQLIAGVVDTKL
jgi:hypothetical protein